MQTVRSEIFARILIYPNHFDKGAISLECFYPRPNEKSGISVCKCSEIELAELKRLGEQIAERQNNKEANLITEFKGILFFLSRRASEAFDCKQTGLKKHHYTMKHKGINYKDKPFQMAPEIKNDHTDLLSESLFLSSTELYEFLTDETNGWDVIYDRLNRLIDE